MQQAPGAPPNAAAAAANSPDKPSGPAPAADGTGPKPEPEGGFLDNYPVCWLILLVIVQVIIIVGVAVLIKNIKVSPAEHEFQKDKLNNLSTKVVGEATSVAFSQRSLDSLTTLNSFWCGIRNITNPKTQKSPDDVIDGEYPWLVKIFSDGKYTCSGTLLTSEWVLTTSSTCLSFNGNALNEMEVVVTDRKNNNSKTIKSKVKKAVLPPNGKIKSDDKKAADIALLQIQTPIKYSGCIHPACIDLAEENRIPDPFDDQSAWYCTVVMHQQKGDQTIEKKQNRSPNLIASNGSKCESPDEPWTQCVDFNGSCPTDTGAPLQCAELADLYKSGLLGAVRWEVQAILISKECIREKKSTAKFVQVDKFRKWVRNVVEKKDKGSKVFLAK